MNRGIGSLSSKSALTLIGHRCANQLYICFVLTGVPYESLQSPQRIPGYPKIESLAIGSSQAVSMLSVGEPVTSLPVV
jgi:hypothetical protein